MNIPPPITSRSNPRIKAIRALRNRKDREASGRFFVEGFHICQIAARTAAPIEEIIVHRAGIRDARVHSFLAEQEVSGIPIRDVSPEVFDSLTFKASSQPIGMVLRQHWSRLEERPPSSCRVVLEGVQYPGNLGTVLRTADAVGCDGVILLDNATDPYDAASVRASLGAILTQPILRATSEEFLAWQQRHNLPLIGASPSAPQDYRTADYPLPLLLLMGRERGGISPRLEQACTSTVRIPMVGYCDSLNLAISTSVLLYGIFGQNHPMP